jgi:hypothetical protein
MSKRLGAIAILVAVVAAAAVLLSAAAVPAASAKSRGQVNLSVLPLPKSSLGPAAQGLRLEHDSGVRRKWGFLGLPLTPNRSLTGGFLDPDGRITGYALDFGLGASGGVGVTEVWTSVDLYKTSADAKKSLAHWKEYVLSLTRYHLGRLAVAIKAEKVAPVGGRRFASLVRYRAANIAPLFGFDEQFTLGRYEADVTVWAGRAAPAERLAPMLARKLEARIKLALAGRLDAKPVKMPPPRKAGRPPGGPDLAALGLKPTELGVQVTGWKHGYGVDRRMVARSSYFDGMESGRTSSDVDFVDFQQQIDWFATANQASFTADSAEGSFAGGVSVDLSSVGDGAWGVLDPNEAELVFCSGRLEEHVTFLRHSPISTSEVLKIAQTVANKINNAGLGS